MRRRRQIKAATMMQIGIAGILLILLVLFLVWYSDGLNSFHPDENTFQFIAGAKIEHSAAAKYRNKDGLIEIADVDGIDTTVGTPILYEGEAKLTLTENMILMIPNEGKGISRVNYFTTITEKDGLCTLTSDGKNAQVRSGFLYNGEDTYVFLENTTLEMGSKKIELAPLSYVKVAYRQSVEYHNSADDAYEWIGITDTDIIARTENGYMVDMGRDVIDMGDGQALLYSAVDSVDVLKMEK